MNHLESAITKLKESARSYWAGSAFAIALTPEEIEAFNAKYPNGLEIVKK